ncbi:BT_3928 family protein [Psychroflexus sp. MBR-150]|jgi:uncharacterized membrane protein YphA (DoxX/SURF4 family)
MKYIYQIARIIVGALFIFSGYVKLVDPLGFSYKLEEYFGPGVFELEFLVPLALPLSVFIVIFELLLGLTLLLGFAPKFTRWSLLLMIIFFTFLTFYSAFFNKVTDCGCFGDAIPLNPWQSFYKDVILLVLILFIFFKKQYLKPILPKSVAFVVFLIAFVVSGYLSYYGLNHLPVVDFRPYHIGANIPESMTVPEGAQKAVYNYHWKFNIDGEEKTITTQGSYPQVDGELIEYETELVDEGYIPPIHDFSLEKNGEDYTEELMAEPQLLMIASYNLSKSEIEAWKAIQPVLEKAKSKGYKLIVLTSSGIKAQNIINEQLQTELDFYFADETAIKTIVRSNPGLLVLNKGTIKQKVHWHDAEDLEF